jgi:ectoine hydroxylase-related dioxygenase (phytanoyl-CoA dioxygenase family)
VRLAVKQTHILTGKIALCAFVIIDDFRFEPKTRPMDVSEFVGSIQSIGFCIVEDVIPANEVDDIRRQVVAAQQAHHAEAEAELAKTRARGHRIGVSGVGLLKQAINATQCFASHLADARLLGIAESFFGDFVRISCTDCVINHPGTERGYWHADWPYNATNTTHVKALYPDVMMHLSSIWMLTDFTRENGATFVLPGSHLFPNNPAAGGMVDVEQDAPHADEKQATGWAGSVLLYDSRLWPAVAPNQSDAARVALVVRYAPWWLNLTPTMRGTPDHDRMVLETGGKNYDAIPIRREVFDALPENVKPLYRHWVTS